jgi:hypothetical protein
MCSGLLCHYVYSWSWRSPLGQSVDHAVWYARADVKQHELAGRHADTESVFVQAIYSTSILASFLVEIQSICHLQWYASRMIAWYDVQMLIKTLWPQKLCKEMVEGMGGASGPDYHKFKEHCCEAYNILRKSANLILNLFQVFALFACSRTRSLSLARSCSLIISSSDPLTCVGWIS